MKSKPRKKGGVRPRNVGRDLSEFNAKTWRLLYFGGDSVTAFCCEGGEKHSIQAIWGYPYCYIHAKGKTYAGNYLDDRFIEISLEKHAYFRVFSRRLGAIEGSIKRLSFSWRQICKYNVFKFSERRRLIVEIANLELSRDSTIRCLDEEWREYKEDFHND